MRDDLLSPVSWPWNTGDMTLESVSLAVFFSRLELGLTLLLVCFYSSHLSPLLEALFTNPNLIQLSFGPGLLYKCWSEGKKGGGNGGKLTEKQTIVHLPLQTRRPLASAITFCVWVWARRPQCPAVQDCVSVPSFLSNLLTNQLDCLPRLWSLCSFGVWGPLDIHSPLSKQEYYHRQC